MISSVSRRIRSFCLVLGLALVLTPQILQPSPARALAFLSVNKGVCDTTSGGPCPATSTNASVGANPNDVIEYYLNYNTTGADVTSNIVLTDQIQQGQTVLSCTSPAATTPAGATFAGCSTSVSNTVTATINNVAPGLAGTIVVLVQLVSVTNPVYDTFSGTATSTTPQQCPQGYSGAVGGECRLPAASATACTFPGSTFNAAGYCHIAYGAYVQVYGSAQSNQTVVIVNTGLPPPVGSCLFISKAVRNISFGNVYSTSIYAQEGNQVQYRIVVTNSCGVTVTGIVVNDSIQGGFVTGSCNPVSCTHTVGVVSFPVGVLVSGGSSTMYFNQTVFEGNGNVIVNVATATSNNATTATSNQTTVTIVGETPPPTYTPPPFVTGPYAATLQICGVLTSYSPSTSTWGYFNMDGINFAGMPYFVPGGAPFAAGGSYCVTLTVNASGQVTSAIFGPNVAGVNFACGQVSPFTPGWNPYPGFNPYPGWNPYPGFGNYPGYGSYTFPGSTSIYGYGGPIMIGGYPFPVAPGTSFPYAINYGNPYCFLMNNGYVNGSLSVVPTAATPVEAAAGVHRSGRHLAL